MTYERAAAALAEALRMAQAEMVTLIPRLPDSYAKNLHGAVAKSKTALKAYDEAMATDTCTGRDNCPKCRSGG